MKKLAVLGVFIAVAFVAGVFTAPKSDLENSNPKVLGVEQTLNSLSVEQFNSELDTGKYTLLDIRTADEYAAGHLKNATQIDYYQTKNFSDYLNSLDKNKKYLIYCRTGNRTGTALNIMRQKGFTHVSELAGGYAAWTASGFPIE